MPKVADGKIQRKITETRTEEVDSGQDRQDDPYMMWRTSPHDQEFFEMLSQIPDEDWQKRKLGVTVYRLDPPVDPQNPDRAGHAFNKSVGFDETYVFSRYGGGRYGYWFREGSKVKYRNSFFIGGQPKHPREWEMEGTPAKEPAQVAGQTADSPVIEKLLELSGSKAVAGSHEILISAFKKAVETLGDKKEDPVAMFELMMKFNTLMQSQSSSSNKLLETLLLKYIDRESNPAQASGPMAKLQEKLLERFLDRMDEGGIEGSNDPWSMIAAKATEAIPGMLDKWAQATAEARKREEAITARAMMMRGYRVTPPPANAVDQAAASTAGPAHSSPVTEQSPPAPQFDIGSFIKAKLLEMLFAGDPGDEAAHVIDKLDPDFALSLANVLKLDPQQLLADPILAKAVQHPNVRQFAKDFVDYFEGEKEEEGEPVEAA